MKKKDRKMVFGIILILGLLIVLNTYSVIKADDPILPPPPPPIPTSSPATPHYLFYSDNTNTSTTSINATYEIGTTPIGDKQVEEIVYYWHIRKDIRWFVR